MNTAQDTLLARLREIIVATPKSGAVNRGGKRLYVTRFAQAVEARAEDGPALVEYVRSKVHEPATESYSALVRAGRPDLAVEAVVADSDAPWTSEFTDDDRGAARERLGAVLEAHAKEREAAKASAVEHYRTAILPRVSAGRVAKGRPSLTPEQEQAMIERFAHGLDRPAT